ELQGLEGGDPERAAGDADRNLARVIQGHLEAGAEGVGTLVDNVHEQAVTSLVAHGNRYGLQLAAQVVERGLRGAQRVNDPPAGAAPQVAPEPYQAAAAARALTAPFSEHCGHDLAGDDPAECQIALVLGITQVDGIEAEQSRQVVVAHVVKVPTRAEIARRTRFPQRLMAADRQPARKLRERALFRNV